MSARHTSCRCRWALHAFMTMFTSVPATRYLKHRLKRHAAPQVCRCRTPVHSGTAAQPAVRWLRQRPWRSRHWSALTGQRCSGAGSRRTHRLPATLAMVNVDFSPALVLGLGMVTGGVLLYNVRINRPWISRDYDVVISSISVLVGGILIFQVSTMPGGYVHRLRRCSSLLTGLGPEVSHPLACRAGGWTRCCCLASC